MDLTLQPTYDEARYWFVWLRCFTPSELADSMAIDTFVAQRFINAGLFWGIIQGTGDMMNGTAAGYEELYEYVPLPPGPRFARTFTPEWRSTPGCYDLAPRRGLPIRIRDEGRARKMGSISGGGAMKEKLRNKRYLAMQEAVEKRKEARKRREHQEPKAKSSGRRKAEAMAARKKEQREAKKQEKSTWW